MSEFEEARDEKAIGGDLFDDSLHCCSETSAFKEGADWAYEYCRGWRNNQVKEMYDWKGKVIDLEEKLKLAVEALTGLSNECKGSLGVGEFEFREILGNTNYECMQLSVDRAKQTLEQITGGGK